MTITGGEVIEFGNLVYASLDYPFLELTDAYLVRRDGSVVGVPYIKVFVRTTPERVLGLYEYELLGVRPA